MAFWMRWHLRWAFKEAEYLEMLPEHQKGQSMSTREKSLGKACGKPTLCFETHHLLYNLGTRDQKMQVEGVSYPHPVLPSGPQVCPYFEEKESYLSIKIPLHLRGKGRHGFESLPRSLQPYSQQPRRGSNLRAHGQMNG